MQDDPLRQDTLCCSMDRTGGAPHLRVCGVLVTYQRPSILLATVAALKFQTHPLAHLIVVDNDPAESARSALTYWPAEEVTYLPTGRNLGPAGGLRAGVEAAADNYEWVMFLDDDDPPPGADVVDSMIGFLKLALSADPNCAGVGAAGALFDARNGVSHRPLMTSPERLLPVDWIGGGMFPIYRVDALTAVDAPNSDLFFGYDDLDLGLRLRRSGATLYRDRDYSVRQPFDHPKKVVHSTPPAWRHYYTTRNLVLIISRGGSRLRAGVIGLRCVASAAARSKGQRRRSFLAAARGLWDGLRGRSGRSGRAGGPG